MSLSAAAKEFVPAFRTADDTDSMHRSSGRRTLKMGAASNGAATFTAPLPLVTPMRSADRHLRMSESESQRSSNASSRQYSQHQQSQAFGSADNLSLDSRELSRASSMSSNRHSQQRGLHTPNNGGAPALSHAQAHQPFGAKTSALAMELNTRRKARGAPGPSSVSIQLLTKLAPPTATNAAMYASHNGHQSHRPMKTNASELESLDDLGTTRSSSSSNGGAGRRIGAAGFQAQPLMPSQLVQPRIISADGKPAPFGAATVHVGVSCDNRSHPAGPFQARLPLRCHYPHSVSGTYYDYLGISMSATDADVDRSYRWWRSEGYKRAKAIGQATADAADCCVVEAHNVLGRPELRQAYDQQLAMYFSNGPVRAREQAIGGCHHPKPQGAANALGPSLEKKSNFTIPVCPAAGGSECWDVNSVPASLHASPPTEAELRRIMSLYEVLNSSGQAGLTSIDTSMQTGRETQSGSSKASTTSSHNVSPFSTCVMENLFEHAQSGNNTAPNNFTVTTTSSLLMRAHVRGSCGSSVHASDSDEREHIVYRSITSTLGSAATSIDDDHTSYSRKSSMERAVEQDMETLLADL